MIPCSPDYFKIQNIKQLQEEIHIFSSVFRKFRNAVWCLFLLLRGGYFWGSTDSVPTSVQDARDRVTSVFDGAFGAIKETVFARSFQVPVLAQKSLLGNKKHWWLGEGVCSFSAASFLYLGAFYCDASVTGNALSLQSPIKSLVTQSVDYVVRRCLASLFVCQILQSKVNLLEIMRDGMEWGCVCV